MDTNERLLSAVQLAARRLASTGHIDTVLRDVLGICVEAVGAAGGTIYLHDAHNKRLTFRYVLPEEVRDKLPFEDIADDYGVAGQVFQSRETVITDFPQVPDEQRNSIESATGVHVRTMITTPLMMENEEPIGVVQVINKLDGKFTEGDVAVLDTVAAVSTMAYHNFRLSDEMNRASTLLGMGKVSHDIGNLAASLYANISFSEMAMGGLREHMTQAKADETCMLYAENLDGMMGELKSSVDRIVGYSRLVSDLSAGRELRPNKKLAPLAETIQTSAAYLETEGRKNMVGLRYDIQEDAPALLHDELYLFRIVQNLVGNAIKAVRETIPDDWHAKLGGDEDALLGEVTVRYRYEPGWHFVEVQDSGPGMSRATADAILAGSARSKWDKGGGSGWGTKIVLELAATHSARVEIDSEPGKGATFRVAFPEITANLEVGGSQETASAV
ncbi:MAG TPA: ATP-binding protein [Fimbriimonadaceae bacterium]|nr:ATP-binding protein [Fimbriimonadaceae bacterium]